MEVLDRYFEAEGLSTDWGDFKEAEEELLINSLSMLLPLRARGSPGRSWRRRALTTRRETLVTLIEFALAKGSTPEGTVQ